MMGLDIGTNSAIKGISKTMEIVMMDGDLDFIKQKISSFQGKNDLEVYLE
jgi:hypothetical protein